VIFGHKKDVVNIEELLQLCVWSNKADQRRHEAALQRWGRLHMAIATEVAHGKMSPSHPAAILANTYPPSPKDVDNAFVALGEGGLLYHVAASVGDIAKRVLRARN
jgi:hypothetical protein